LKDCKREWTLATHGYKAVADAANINANTGTTEKCGVNADKLCSASGFKYADAAYTSLTNDVFRTGGCSTVTA